MKTREIKQLIASLEEVGISPVRSPPNGWRFRYQGTRMHLYLIPNSPDLTGEVRFDFVRRVRFEARDGEADTYWESELLASTEEFFTYETPLKEMRNWILKQVLQHS